MELAQRLRGGLDVLVSDDDGEGKAVRVEMLKKMRLNHAMPGIAFRGNPGQCEPDTCRELQKMFDWRRTMSVKEASRYKYVLDVDGNGWSSRFKRLMTTNALVIKYTVYLEWFTNRLVPWVYYVLVQIDYSDLYDALVFFRGDLAGRGVHEDLVARIAREGNVWCLKF